MDRSAGHGAENSCRWKGDDPTALLDVTFGAVSQHLAVLRQAEFVTVRKEGNRRLYRADQEALRPFKEVLETMWGGTLHNLADEIEAAEGNDR